MATRHWAQRLLFRRGEEANEGTTGLVFAAREKESEEKGTRGEEADRTGHRPDEDSS